MAAPPALASPPRTAARGLIRGLVGAVMVMSLCALAPLAQGSDEILRTANNLRPVIPANPGGERIIAWGRGTYPNCTDYRTDICILTEKRE